MRAPCLVSFALVFMLASAWAAAPAAAHGSEASHAGEGGATSSMITILPTILRENATWEGADRVVNASLALGPGVTLTIRGIQVAFENVTVTVTPSSRLVVESTLDAAARLVGSHADGWGLEVYGPAEMRGTPDSPVFVSGLGGAGSRGLAVYSFNGGIHVAAGGRLDASYVTFADYASGVYIDGANATFEQVAFRSGKGLGLVSSTSQVALEHATFVGAGAKLVVTSTQGGFTGRDLSFETSGDRAISVLRSVAVFERVKSAGAGTCLVVEGFGRVAVRDFECRDYQTVGILASADGRGGRALALDGLSLSSAANASGIAATRATALELRNATLGPINGTAIVQENGAPLLANVTFTGVRDYALVLRAPKSAELPTAPPGAGEPGRLGWTLVQQPLWVGVVDTAKTPILDARVTAVLGDGETPVVDARTDAKGATGKFFVDALRIDGNGTIDSLRYDVTAFVPGSKTPTTASVVPNGTFVLLQVPTPARAVPGPAFLWLGAILLVAALARRARW